MTFPSFCLVLILPSIILHESAQLPEKDRSPHSDFQTRPLFRKRVMRAQCESRCFALHGTRFREWIDDAFGALRCENPKCKALEDVLGDKTGKPCQRQDDCKSCVTACRQTYQQESRCVQTCDDDTCQRSCRFFYDLLASNSIEKSGKTSALKLEKPFVLCRQNMADEQCRNETLQGIVFLRSLITDNGTVSLGSILYLVEIKSDTRPAWAFLSDSPSPVHRVFCLQMDSRYKFRITPVAQDGVVGVAKESDWIETLSNDVPPSAPLRPRQVSTPRLTASSTPRRSASSPPRRSASSPLSTRIAWSPNRELSCFYKVYWMSTDEEDYHDSRDIGPIVTRDVQLQLHGLHFDREYQINIFAKDSSRESPAAIFAIQTPSCLDATKGDLSVCAPRPPLKMEVVKINVTEADVVTATLMWDAPEGEASGIGGYHLQWRKIPDLISAAFETPHADEMTLPSHVHSASISGLHLGSSYRLLLRASSDGGTSTPASLTFRTPSDGHQVASSMTWKEPKESLSLPVLSAVFGILLFVAVAALSFVLSKRRFCRQGTGPKLPVRNGVIGSTSIPTHRSSVGGISFSSASTRKPSTVSMFTPGFAHGAMTLNCENAIYADIFEIDPRNLITQELLGQGAFGRVLKGELQQLEDGKDGGRSETLGEKSKASNSGAKTTPLAKTPVAKATPVAVKTLKEGATAEDVSIFLEEIHLMKTIGCHPNILSIIGCVTHGPNPCVIMEFCPHGDLRNFLKRHREGSPSHLFLPPISPEPSSLPQLQSKSSPVPASPLQSLKLFDLLSFARQISCGMEYLASKKFVHRDLAARNILVAVHNVVKISDFGLTRDVYEDDVYRKLTAGKLPFKWMSPEAIFDQVYTTKSDVWAFGVVVWEIMTLGGCPYPGINSTDLFRLLRDGYRMEPTPFCPPEVDVLMRRCWEAAPEQRPDFRDLTQQLEKILAEQTKDMYLDLQGQATSVNYAQISVSRSSLTSSDVDSEDGGMTGSELSGHQSMSIDAEVTPGGGQVDSCATSGYGSNRLNASFPSPSGNTNEQSGDDADEGADADIDIDAYIDADIDADIDAYIDEGVLELDKPEVGVGDDGAKRVRKCGIAMQHVVFVKDSTRM